MTDREQAAFRAGILHAADMAFVAAITIDARDDAKQVRQKAAIAALRALAEGLKAQAAEPASGEAS